LLRLLSLQVSLQSRRRHREPYSLLRLMREMIMTRQMRMTLLIMMRMTKPVLLESTVIQNQELASSLMQENQPTLISKLHQLQLT
jgi:hypothetical protein